MLHYYTDNASKVANTKTDGEFTYRGTSDGHVVTVKS